MDNRRRCAELMERHRTVYLEQLERRPMLEFHSSESVPETSPEYFNIVVRNPDEYETALARLRKRDN